MSNQNADVPKVRLKTLADLDRRTLAAKAVYALRDAIVSDLGGREHLSAMQLELIDNVALLGAMLKDSAASYLSGEPVDLTEFMSLTNAQRRLLADLGLERRQKAINADLRSYLSGKVSA
ncbi:hypothetical protein REJC140_03858 [Pseudorhizobium endolithicum]|uniref:Uncharacterized protein n=1 Tax=Pseudorhizobium endolithicum TaxID=1191678 RepID=A0ABM8PRM7_9HYPH|nr:hypothetical protein [Pseudorhizobium endolithicum]CAD7044722.1 hypothetical protein REJC140_03858 [Pseudorhizobium endolithicum]